MPILRFLQLSDLHLDSSLTAGRLGLPAEKVRIRQREIRAILPSACSLAAQRGVDVVLIPGDLFDDEAVTMDTVNFVSDAVAGLSPIQVVIAPGNHDFYSLGSPYNNDLLAARRQKPWPANVRILSRGAWEVFRLDHRQDVSITGMAHAASTPIGDRLLASPVPRDDAAAFNLLVFHGSREVTELPRGKLRTLPFSDAELASQRFDYAAIGHYHEAATITDDRGRVVGAYSGCPAGRGLDETGEKSLSLGEIEREGQGESARVRLEHVALDQRRIHLVEVPCTGLTHRDAIFRRAEELLAL